jgi:Uma2 family endonuclease
VVASGSTLSLHDLEQLPRDGRRWDVVFGRVIEMPPAWPESSRVAAELIIHLGVFVRHQSLDCVVFGSDAGFLLAEPAGPGEPPTLVSPDASVVERARLPADTPPGFWLVVPDLAVEVVSPSDRWRDVEDKIAAYLQAGVRLLWVLDPRTQSATIYAPGRSPRTLRAPDDVLDGGEVLPGFQVALRELFRDPRRASST